MVAAIKIRATGMVRNKDFRPVMLKTVLPVPASIATKTTNCNTNELISKG